MKREWPSPTSRPMSEHSRAGSRPHGAGNPGHKARARAGQDTEKKSRPTSATYLWRWTHKLLLDDGRFGRRVVQRALSEWQTRRRRRARTEGGIGPHNRSESRGSLNGAIGAESRWLLRHTRTGEPGDLGGTTDLATGTTRQRFRRRFPVLALNAHFEGLV